MNEMQDQHDQNYKELSGREGHEKIAELIKGHLYLCHRRAGSSRKAKNSRLALIYSPPIKTCPPCRLALLRLQKQIIRQTPYSAATSGGSEMDYQLLPTFFAEHIYRFFECGESSS
jgi:hypothetical protein